MAKFLARDIVVKIGTNEIKELTSVEHAQNETNADMTTFTSAGPESINVWVQDTFTLQGKADPADAGQQAVDTCKRAVGTGRKATFSVTLPNGDLYGFDANVSGSLFGGGGTDGANWGATLTVTGGVTYTAGTGGGA